MKLYFCSHRGRWRGVQERWRQKREGRQGYSLQLTHADFSWFLIPYLKQMWHKALVLTITEECQLGPWTPVQTKFVFFSGCSRFIPSMASYGNAPYSVSFKDPMLPSTDVSCWDAGTISLWILVATSWLQSRQGGGALHCPALKQRVGLEMQMGGTPRNRGIYPQNGWWKSWKTLLK